MVPLTLCGMRYRLVLLTLCAVLSGCHSVVAGTAQPADHLGPLPTAVAAPPNPSNPRDKLLAAAEVAGIVGEASMTEVGSAVEPERDTRVKPSDCTPLALPNDDWLYTNYVQLNAALYRGDGKHDVAQVVSTFKDATAATNMLSYAVYTWQKCTAPFTIDQEDGAVRHVAPGPVTSTDTRASAAMQSQDNAQRSCQHVLAAKSNFVVEVELCGDDGQTARQADEVTDKILAKIPG